MGGRPVHKEGTLYGVTTPFVLKTGHSTIVTAPRGHLNVPLLKIRSAGAVAAVEQSGARGARGAGRELESCCKSLSVPVSKGSIGPGAALGGERETARKEDGPVVVWGREAGQ